MTLYITIKGKVAIYAGIERVVKNNTDYVISFDFSESGFSADGIKWLVLITDKGKYDAIPFTGCICPLPAFGEDDGSLLKIGIYEGELVTTTPAYIPLTESILSVESAEAEPSDQGGTPVIDEIADGDYMIILPDGGVKSVATIATLKAILGGGGGSNLERLEAEYGVTTLAQITAAYNSRKIITVAYADPVAGETNILELDDVSGSGNSMTFTFTGLTTSGYIRTATISSDGWRITTTVYATTIALAGKQDLTERVNAVSAQSTDDEYPTAKAVYSGLAGKEDALNKVTSLSSSSTDAQFPSAKCVYDIVGDIESLLSSI